MVIGPLNVRIYYQRTWAYLACIFCGLGIFKARELHPVSTKQYLVASWV